MRTFCTIISLQVLPAQLTMVHLVIFLFSILIYLGPHQESNILTLRKPLTVPTKPDLNNPKQRVTSAQRSSIPIVISSDAENDAEPSLFVPPVRTKQQLNEHKKASKRRRQSDSSSTSSSNEFTPPESFEYRIKAYGGISRGVADTRNFLANQREWTMRLGLPTDEVPGIQLPIFGYTLSGKWPTATEWPIFLTSDAEWKALVEEIMAREKLIYTKYTKVGKNPPQTAKSLLPVIITQIDSSSQVVFLSIIYQCTQCLMFGYCK